MRTAGAGRVLISAPGFGRTGDGALRMLREAGGEIVLNERGTEMSEQGLPAAVLDAAPRLRVISRRGVGYDSVDVAAATARGIPVAITGGVLSDAVADLTMALILAVARRAPELDRLGKTGGGGRPPAAARGGEEG